ncbi:MAG TPA: hypothetical protein VHL05_08230, partial [Terriglobales bacterium]|nr:hypothetical protein [Terriglobales bacterium]
GGKKEELPPMGAAFCSMKNVMMNDACSVSLQDKRAQFDLDDSGGKTQNSDLRDLARSVSPDPFHCKHIYSASASCEEE